MQKYKIASTDCEYHNENCRYIKTVYTTCYDSKCDVSFNRSTLLQKMEKLLSLWVDGLNKKNIPLTQAVITPWAIKINAGALQ